MESTTKVLARSWRIFLQIIHCLVRVCAGMPSSWFLLCFHFLPTTGGSSSSSDFTLLSELPVLDRRSRSSGVTSFCTVVKTEHSGWNLSTEEEQNHHQGTAALQSKSRTWTRLKPFGGPSHSWAEPQGTEATLDRRVRLKSSTSMWDWNRTTEFCCWRRFCRTKTRKQL